MSSLSLQEVVTAKELKLFIDFPHDLYRGDPNYVPELFMAQKDLLNKKKHPFFEYGELTAYLAYQDNRIVGRIAAIKNPAYNDYHNSSIGFFGFYDYIDSSEVAKALLDQAKAKLKSENFTQLMGPVNFSTNETAGTLVAGFDSPPKVMMTYNKPYYDRIQKQIGLTKEMDLFAFFIPTYEASERSIKMSNIILQRLERQGITVRNLNIKKIKEEAPQLRAAYNAAWEKNWGFVPMNEKEFSVLVSDLKLIADGDFAYVAEHEGKIVGFSVSLPDVNEIIINFKKGRLFPFNIIKLLLNKKKVKSVRIITTGVIEGYRKKGIEAIFFAKNIQQARERKLIGGEASWILESNKEMVLAAEKLNGEKYKTYRLYTCPAS